MKKLFASFCAFACLVTAPAQEQTIDPTEIITSAEEFLRENVDETVLEALGVDAERVEEFLSELRRQFQGSYIYDLGALRETAAQLLPVLQQFEETEPYAIWLKSHLDYFVVAEKLKASASAAPSNTIHLPAPSAQAQRKAWVTVVEERPMPPLAFKQVTTLKKIFMAEQVPPELVWLAEVESSFDSKARSPAGAVGLFQLMPVTARSLDLSVGLLGDERLHPEKNARAAAQYLRQLHNRFGNWRLALAAYNAGPSRVAELLKKQKAKTFDDIAHRLPSETQMFVPKVEAIVQKREGRTLAGLKTPRS